MSSSDPARVPNDPTVRLSVDEDDIGVFAEAVEKDSLAIRRNVEAADGITGPEFSELTKTARSEIAEPEVLFTERTLK